MGRYDLRRASEPLSVVVGRNRSVAAWQAFESQRGPRYRCAPHRALIAADGSLAASITKGEGKGRRKRRVLIADRVAFETHQRGVHRPRTLVTDARTGEPILAYTGPPSGTFRNLPDRRVKAEFTNGRVLTFSVVVGTERDAGVSPSQRRFVVMFAIDGSGTTLFIARATALFADPWELSVVLCVDGTPEILLVALLASPVASWVLG
jgi:hypothetical protein